MQVSVSWKFSVSVTIVFFLEMINHFPWKSLSSYNFPAKNLEENTGV